VPVAAIKAGYTAVAVIAVMFSLIGAFYYLRVVKLMYFDAPNASAPPTESHPGVRLALGLNALAVLVLGLFPESLLSLCEQVLG